MPSYYENTGRGTPLQSGSGFMSQGSSSGYGSSTPSYTAPSGSGSTYQSGLPSNIEEITNLINRLNQTAQQQANAARIPNASGLEAQSSANIQSNLAGEVPADVMRQLAQQAAERGVAGGFSGSPNDSAAYLKALGLTSLDLQQTGQANLTSALGRNPAAQTFDPTSMLLNPYQAASLNQQNQQLALSQWQAQQQAAYQNSQLGLQQQQVNNQTRASYAATKPKEYSLSHQIMGPDGRPFGQPTYDYQYWK